MLGFALGSFCLPVLFVSELFWRSFAFSWSKLIISVVWELVKPKGQDQTEPTGRTGSKPTKQVSSLQDETLPPYGFVDLLVSNHFATHWNQKPRSITSQVWSIDCQVAQARLVEWNFGGFSWLRFFMANHLDGHFGFRRGTHFAQSFVTILLGLQVLGIRKLVTGSI